jgi:hypothetical protein
VGAVQNLANSRVYNLEKSGGASSARLVESDKNASKFEAVNAIVGYVTDVSDDTDR